MSTGTKNIAETRLRMPLEKLASIADNIRRKYVGAKLELCSILNAKSGLCCEDCKFCSQSARHHTDAPVYPLKKKEEILMAAEHAKTIGAERFGIVTSGNELSGKEVETIAQAISEIKNKVDISVCASLGAMDKQRLKFLKQAGLQRFHHNIETSRRFYPQIVSTHSFDDRIYAIKLAKEVGLEVCSGGIVGMGETWQDRIDMAYTLKKLEVDSVPINILIPVKGTALEKAKPMSTEDVIRTICIFRIVLKDKTIKVAAGREAALKESQLNAFLAGANGMIIGGYLTVKGSELEDDYTLIGRINKAWMESKLS
jgi:biotin synthase